jgi:hypothetical protein
LQALKLNNKSPYDAFHYLEAVPVEDWPYEPCPLAVAAKQFDPNAPEPLLRLLRSPDPGVARSGLFLFAWLGKAAHVVLDSALELVRSENWMSRNYLIDGTLSYTNALTAAQVAILLPLAEDPSAMVREKAIAMLGAVQIRIMQEAIAKISCADTQKRHAKCLELFDEPIPSPQDVFDEALNAEKLKSSYMFASIQRLARRDENMNLAVYGGPDRVGTGVAANAIRLAARTKRIRLSSAKK